MCGMSSYVAMSFLQISRPPVIILNFDVSNLKQKNRQKNSWTIKIIIMEGYLCGRFLENASIQDRPRSDKNN